MVRLRNRYFLCELIFDETNSTSNFVALPRLTTKSVHLAVKGVVEEIHGEYGAAACSVGLNVKYINQDTNIILIRVRRHANKILGTSLPFIKQIAKYECVIKMLHIGGTLRSCRKYLVKYSRQQLTSLLKRCQTQEERRRVQESINKTTATLESDNPFKRGEDSNDESDSESDESDIGD